MKHSHQVLLILILWCVPVFFVFAIFKPSWPITVVIWFAGGTLGWYWPRMCQALVDWLRS